MNPRVDHFLGHSPWQHRNFKVATNDRHDGGQPHTPPSAVVYRRQRNRKKEQDGELDVGIREVICGNDQERKSDPIKRPHPWMFE